MKKSYKVKIHQGADKSTEVDLQTSEFLAEPTTVQALAGARYQFIAPASGLAPDNIRIRRAGKHLFVSFEDHEHAELVIANYYEHADPGFNALIGEAQAGVFYAYIPESAEMAATVSSVADGAVNIGMALGGEQVLPAGAAVGTLVGAALSPLWAAPLALLGVAGAAGGGSGNGSGDGSGGGGVAPAKPKVLSAKLAQADDSGLSSEDGITRIHTPHIDGLADPGTLVTVLINGHTYTQTADAQGHFSIAVTDPLPDGVQAFEVVAQNAAGSSAPWVGTPFTVDTSAQQNYSPTAQSDVNQGLKIDVTAMARDTGVKADDFITSDNTLMFSGTLDKFSANGDQVEVQLLDAADQVVAQQSMTPAQLNGRWGWSWDLTARTLPDATYTLIAQVKDPAGNRLTALAAQTIVVDTNVRADANAPHDIAVTRLDQDTGASDTDFLTHARGLTFKGTTGGSPSGFAGKVRVELTGLDGKILSMDHVDLAQDGSWVYDNTARQLGTVGTSTQYLLRASLVDLAGNILKTTDQSFVVDLKVPVFTIGGDFITDSTSYVRYNTMVLRAGSLGDLSDAEKGAFAFTDGHGAPLTLPSKSTGASATYDPGQFVITYTDLAGNSFQLKNDKRWEFKLQSDIVVDAAGSQTTTNTFGQGELAGSVGRWWLMPEDTVVDLGSWHSNSPKTGDNAALNHIGLSGGGVSAIANVDHTLKLSMGDVLALGVKNSFVSTGAFRDHQQMRIDGDAGDKVVLDDLVGGSAAHQWTQAPTLVEFDGAKYRVFSNADLALDLFVQQAIQTILV